jgi:tetratricopeptide (TPR) repeat protein
MALSLPQLSIVSRSFTPLYASPQQERGLPADPRDDVYALGVVWNQMLTGDLTMGAPRGRNWCQRLEKKGMIPGLIDLLSDCVDDDPESRPSDAAVLSERIAEFLCSRSVTELLNDGKALFESGEYDEANIEFSEALRFDPGCLDAIYWLGRVNHEKREYDDAASRFVEAMRLGKNDGECNYWAGRTCLEQYEKITWAGRTFGEQYVESAYDMREVDYIRRAISFFKRAIDLHPGNAELLSWIGRSYHVVAASHHLMAGFQDDFKDAFSEAVEAFKEAVRLDPKEFKYRDQLVKMFCNIKDYAGAVAFLKESLRLQPGSGPLLLLLAGVYESQKITEEAMSCYKEAVRHNPESAEYHSEYGYALYLTGQYEESIAEYKLAIAIKPREGDYELLALCYVEIGKYEEAVENFEIFKQLEGSDTGSGLEYGKALFHTGNYEKAFALLNDCTADNYEDGEALYYLGYTSCNLHDYKGAAECFDAAAECLESDYVAIDRDNPKKLHCAKRLLDCRRRAKWCREQISHNP